MNNPNMINPNPQLQQPNYNPYQTLPFVLVQDMAMASGRSATTGRYMSRGAHDMNYSGHSIRDRTIAKPEELLNEGVGPHDEAVVDAGIRMIEQNR